MSGICPGCKVEIAQIIHFVSTTKEEWLTIRQDKFVYSTKDSHFDENDCQVDKWLCTSCHREIANTEEEAIAFLKNKGE